MVKYGKKSRTVSLSIKQKRNSQPLTPKTRQHINYRVLGLK